MKVIGVSGLAGSGKDAFAGFLPGYRKLAFADPLKDFCRVLFRLSHAQVRGSLADKEAVDPRWGVSPRQILQRAGTELGRDGNLHEFEDLGISADHVDFVLGMMSIHPGPTCWVDACVDRIYRAGPSVVTDVRFPNEAAAIRALGGVVVRIERPGVERGAHASEALAFEADVYVLNDGTLYDLETKALVFLIEAQ